MKNYLFAPFENEEDKMMTWNSCKSGIDQGIMIFLGRLESTYDTIIHDIKHRYNELDDKYEELKAENKELKHNNSLRCDYDNEGGN